MGASRRYTHPARYRQNALQEARGASDHTSQGAGVKAVEEQVRADTYGLSEREVQVLHCIADGLNNREIAEKLFLSEGTIKLYFQYIFENGRPRPCASIQEGS